jgi:hypothetical protein
MAALRKPIILIFWFPMIVSRSGRGLMYMFLTLPMITKEAATIVLGVLILLFGVFNIFLGWNEPAVLIQTSIGGITSKETNSVQR